MPASSDVLGILKPMGGGDPVPLRKTEIVIGRRPSCDLILDFTNISGKHCVLRLLNNVWHVRDLGSTNGTTVNGSQIVSEHSIMPDDELGVAGHYFTIDYEPGGPESVIRKHEVLDEDLSESRKRHSLMELAGLDTDENKPRHRRPARAPEHIQRLSADEAEFEDELPEHVKNAPPPVAPAASDEDFLKMIQDDDES